MPLQDVNQMMTRALGGVYAVGYFESWNLESLQGVIDAAEKTESPVIIGFNGEFLSSPDRVVQERLSWHGALGRAAADSASVPCGFIFNECPRADWVKQACDCGFNLVMPVDSGEEDCEFKSEAAEIVRYAHARNVMVEAEVGNLPCNVSGMEETGTMTDPATARDFVRTTGIDLLAVSVGNVHVKTDGETGLDLELLEAIRNETELPLVLHGGSGIAADALADAIAMGVAKVNYGTYLKQRYLIALADALNSDETNPHALLGMGGPKDLLVKGRRAISDAVMERMEILGCCGKARES